MDRYIRLDHTDKAILLILLATDPTLPLGMHRRFRELGLVDDKGLLTDTGRAVARYVRRHTPSGDPTRKKETTDDV